MPKQIGSFEYVVGMNIDEMTEKLKKLEDEFKKSGKKAGDSIKLTPKLDKAETKKQFNFLEEQAKRVKGKLMEAFGMQQLVTIGIQQLSRFFQFIGDGMKEAAKYNKEYGDSFKTIGTEADLAKLRIGNFFTKVASNIMGGPKTNRELQQSTERFFLEKMRLSNEGGGDYTAVKEDIKSLSQFDLEQQIKITKHKEYLSLLKDESAARKKIKKDAEDALILKENNTRLQKIEAENEILLNQAQAESDDAQRERDIQDKKITDAKTKYQKDMTAWAEKQMVAEEKQKKDMTDSIEIIASLTEGTIQLAEALGMSSEEAGKLKDNLNTATTLISKALSGDAIGVLTGSIGYIINSWAESISQIQRIYNGTNDKLYAQKVALEQIEEVQNRITSKASLLQQAMGLNLTDAQKSELTKMQLEEQRSSINKSTSSGYKGLFTRERFISDAKYLTGSDAESVNERKKADDRARQAEAESSKKIDSFGIDKLISNGMNGDKNAYLKLLTMSDIMFDIYGVDLTNKIMGDLFGIVQTMNPNDTSLLDAENNRLNILKDQTEELKKQKELTASNIEQMVNAGLLDPDNFFNISQIEQMISASKYTLGEKMNLYGSIGATGVDSIDNSVGNNIGTINITINEASGETVEQAISRQLATALKPIDTDK